MNLPSDPGHHVWPSKSQEQLLQAALADDGSAEERFLAWLDGYDIEGVVDEGTYRSLPLLWFNLSREGVDHPLMPRLKGIFRNAWVTSQQVHRIAADALAVLGKAGIRTMVSKGLPLSTIYYPKPAFRPMADVDIIVSPGDVRRASEALKTIGFEAPSARWRHELALRHALSHKRSDGREVDLHWHVLYECPSARADSFFWDNAVPMLAGDAETLRPCATGLLTHILVHGIRWNLSPPMRWIADAMMILRSEDAIDWDRLSDFAVAERLNRRVALGLGYLRATFGAAVPANVVDALYRHPSIYDRMEIAAMRGSGAKSPWRHVRRSAYALRLFRSDHASALPGALAAEAAARVKARLRGRAAG